MLKKGKLECIVLKECMTVLDMFGVFHWRQNTGAFRTKSGGYFKSSSMNGISDICAVMPDGRFLAIECKREKGGIVSDAQKAFLQKVKDNNALAIVVNDATELADFLKSELK